MMSNDATNSLEITLDQVLHRNAERTFTVAKAKTHANETILVIGNLGHLQEGESARIEGGFERHKQYGSQFRVRNYTPIFPESIDGLSQLLASGIVPGIGKVLGERIAKTFGPKTIDVITKESARVAALKGVGKQKAADLREYFLERRGEADTKAALAGFGFGPKLQARIAERYGEQTLRSLHENPYRLMHDVTGVGFDTADNLARQIGIEQQSPMRAQAVLHHALDRAEEQGLISIEREKIFSFGRSYNLETHVVEESLQQLIAQNQLLPFADRIYRKQGFLNESLWIEFLVAASEQVAHAIMKATSSGSKAYASISGQELNDKQSLAVELSTQTRFLILTGGPGTGKTTTLRAIVAQAEHRKERIVLAAPTGRAAQRMSELSGVPASTLHRLLEWNPRENRFTKREDDPLAADVVVVDEASMVDLQLATALLRALPSHARLVLVGDADQLPPVGPGDIFGALCAAGFPNLVRLDQVYRQSERSSIALAAAQIREGEVPTSAKEASSTGGDFFVLTFRDSEHATERLEQVLARAEAAYGINRKSDLAILTPTRKGPLGTQALNEFLRDLAHAEANQTSSSAEKFGFRVGDKVMQTENDYEREIWNGDVGFVERIDGDIVYIDFAGRMSSFREHELRPIALAYASTIHKSQGSEYPAVIVILDPSHFALLHRSLVYTAITRGKKLVVVLDRNQSLSRAIARTQDNPEHAIFRQRLQSALQPSEPKTS